RRRPRAMRRRRRVGATPATTRVRRIRPGTIAPAPRDFLWRAHLRTPGKGEVVIFNRSYYEDVLVVRVHQLVDKSVWSKRYDLISDFETMLSRAALWDRGYCGSAQLL